MAATGFADIAPGSDHRNIAESLDDDPFGRLICALDACFRGRIAPFRSSDHGLLASATDPNGNTTSFTYDDQGPPDAEHVPTGSGSDSLTRTDVPVTNGSGYQIVHSTGEGVQTGYQVEFLPTGDQVRTTPLPDGTTQTTSISMDGSQNVTKPDGTVQLVTNGPDPRFGMQVPVAQSRTIATGDRTATVTNTRSGTLALYVLFRSSRKLSTQMKLGLFVGFPGIFPFTG